MIGTNITALALAQPALEAQAKKQQTAVVTMHGIVILGAAIWIAYKWLR